MTQLASQSRPPQRSRRAGGEAPPSVTPEHVALIMDGNGRWARSHGIPRSEGHRAGTDNVRRIVEAFSEHGVRYLTLYAFSTENWHRPENEVSTLLEILKEVTGREAERLHEQGVRIRHIGRLDRVSKELQEAVHDSLTLTEGNSGLTLSVALDYGGRDEILDAVRRVVSSRVPPEEVTEEVFRSFLYTNGLPDPDLIVRTGGEMRLSNFLLWQSAYAEFYSTPVYWPDFDEAEVAKSLAVFAARQRRFGKLAAEQPE